MFRPEQDKVTQETSGFVPALVVPDCKAARSAPAGSAADGTIEIEFANGARIRVTGVVDEAALKAAVEALADRKLR